MKKCAANTNHQINFINISPNQITDHIKKDKKAWVILLYLYFSLSICTLKEYTKAIHHHHLSFLSCIRLIWQTGSSGCEWAECRWPIHTWKFCPVLVKQGRVDQFHPVNVTDTKLNCIMTRHWYKLLIGCVLAWIQHKCEED